MQRSTFRGEFDRRGESCQGFACLADLYIRPPEEIQSLRIGLSRCLEFAKSIDGVGRPAQLQLESPQELLPGEIIGVPRRIPLCRVFGLVEMLQLILDQSLQIISPRY